MSAVFATKGGRRYHKTRACFAFNDGQYLWRFDPREWVPGMPQIMLSSGHAWQEMTVTDAFGQGKEPCAECFPGQRAALYRSSSEDDFGRQPAALRDVIHPNWTRHSACQGCRSGSTDLVCARCMEFDANGMWRIPAHPVHWPCTSAVVLGLTDRKEIAA